jgi:glycosyltransferase involved in cell wall biosynthesis
MKIASVIDVHNWAWEIKMDSIREFIDPKYEIDVFYSRDRPFAKTEVLNKYDLVLAFAWGKGTGKRPVNWDNVTTKKVLCQCSHYLSRFVGFYVAPSFDAVIVNNKMLYQEFRNYDVHLCPNGVDTTKFRPKGVKHSGFRIGYVGNSKSRGEKGFTDIIEPNVAKKWLFGLDRQKDRTIPHEFMPNYYNQLDMFLVMSKCEGTPNPGLEAMACGIPCVSTKVGNMVDIIEDGKNGFLIDRDAKPMVEKIRYYYDNPDERKKHGERVRKIMEEKWDWRQKVKNYEKAFESIMSV